MKTMIEFKPYECPVCGGDLEEDDIIDTWEEDVIYTELCVGVCADCGRKFQWKNHYYHKFEGISEIKET